MFYNKKPKLLDLFCGAGGAAKGYQRAGFYVVGVDIKPQPHYCGDEFYQADALTFPLDGYDAYHASPPCQVFCDYIRSRPDLNLVEIYPDLIEPIRLYLIPTCKPFVIENVRRAPLKDYVIRLCGSSFYLPIRRHRYFESNTLMMAPPCNHGWQKPQYPSSSDRKPLSRRTMEIGSWDIPLRQQRDGMGIDWMTVEELSEAIPPAYTEYIGKYLMEAVKKNVLL